MPESRLSKIKTNLGSPSGTDLVPRVGLQGHLVALSSICIAHCWWARMFGSMEQLHRIMLELAAGLTIICECGTDKRAGQDQTQSNSMGYARSVNEISKRGLGNPQQSLIWALLAAFKGAPCFWPPAMSLFIREGPLV